MRFFLMMLGYLCIVVLGVAHPATAGFPKSCATDFDCDDGLYCNGSEQCVGGQCYYGSPILCNDGVACTIDSCNNAQAMCIHSAPDADGDGHTTLACGGDDCDDNDVNRYPGNVEVCDAVNHDEDCDPVTFGTKDSDQDGFLDAACCNYQPDSTLTCGSDCNDNNSTVHPNQAEVCNGIDDNCVAGIDEGLRVVAYPDLDGDNYGDATGSPTNVCPGTPGFSTFSTDCDDTDYTVYPGVMRCTTGGDIQICGKLGLWQVATPCPGIQTCVAQPNGTGLCLPLPQSADVNGDGKIGLAEAINALGIVSGQTP